MMLKKTRRNAPKSIGGRNAGGENAGTQGRLRREVMPGGTSGEVMPLPREAFRSRSAFVGQLPLCQAKRLLFV